MGSNSTKIKTNNIQFSFFRCLECKYKSKLEKKTKNNQKHVLDRETEKKKHVYGVMVLVDDCY